MRQPTLRILLLEDSPADAELVTLELRHAGLDAVTQRVDTEDAFVRAVRDFAPDLVLSDHSLAQFNSTAALRLLPTIRPRHRSSWWPVRSMRRQWWTASRDCAVEFSDRTCPECAARGGAAPLDSLRLPHRRPSVPQKRPNSNVPRPAMLHPHRGLSHITVMTVDPGERNTERQPRAEAELRRAALSQLLKGGPFAEALHVLLVLVVAGLVWDSLPRDLTIGWVGAVAAAAGLRTLWRLRVRKQAAPSEEALRGVRLTVAGVGLAWGVGAAAAIPALQPDEAALILVVFAGILAGATSTLVGDRRSFRFLLVTMLAPLPVGILLQGQTRFHIFALVLIAAFAWSMDRVHARAHRTFVERIRATALLDVSTQELARQHAYLEPLLTMAPVAITVIDRERRIRHVNRQFTALFGYEARHP